MPAALPIPNCDECGPTDCSVTPAAECDCPSEVVNVALVADMAATTPYAGLRQFNVRGWQSINDGMGGIWIYDPTSTETADGYYIIDPGSGRYIKQI